MNKFHTRLKTKIVEESLTTLQTYDRDKKLVAVRQTENNLPDRDPGDPVPVYDLAVSDKHCHKLLACDEIGNVTYFRVSVSDGLTQEASLHISDAPLHNVCFSGPTDQSFLVTSSSQEVIQYDFSIGKLLQNYVGNYWVCV